METSPLLSKEGWKHSLSSFKAGVLSGFGQVVGVFSRFRNHKLGACSFLLLTSLLLVTLLWIQYYHESFYYVVSVDEKEIGLVEEKEEVKVHLDQQQEKKEEKYGMEVAPEEKVAFAREYRPGERDNLEGVKEALSELTYYTVGYYLVIEEEPQFLVQSREEYEEILEKVKNHLIDESSDRNLLNVDFQEDVYAKKTETKPEKIISMDEAVDRLVGGAEKEKAHLVSRGENLSRIAQRHEVSLSELEEANPQLSSVHNVREGEEIKLKYTESLVTVEAEEKITVEESIPYEVETVEDSSIWRGETKVKEPGEKGIKEVTYRVKLENDREVDREKVEEEVIKEPVRQLEAQGTASAPSPSSTSGSFMWPVQGGGTLTQSFHAAHRAIDIASSYRTPILAAHSGTVDRVESYAGASGNYIQLKHEIGGTVYYTRYLHNDENLVSVGEQVNQGDVIARMGSTGRSTGVHLHFEIHRGSLNNRVNPLDYFDR